MSDIVEEMGGYLGDGSEFAETPKPNTTDSELLDILVELDLADASPSLKKILEPDSRKSLHVQKAKARIKALIATKVEEARVEELNWIKSCFPNTQSKEFGEKANRLVDGLHGYINDRIAELSALQSREQDKV